tara:strand:- start:6971 stop:7669 length:699 start_codon:yes stop_codon:yes gene_type:complete
MFQEISVLNKKECGKVNSTIQKLRKNWIQRHALAPLFTLGAASYFDAKLKGRNYYQKLAKQNNPILESNFGWLYEKIITSLKRYLNGSISLDTYHALPGFHIFQYHPMFTIKTGEIHCDLQFKNLDWSMLDPLDIENPISFTLSIDLPKKGAGLYYWNYLYNESIGLSKMEIKKEFQRKKRNYFPYTEGKMIIHSGLLVHQIAPMKNSVPSDNRLTLQGHAIYGKGTWHLYW